jgi:hypothetical protein
MAYNETILSNEFSIDNVAKYIDKLSSEGQSNQQIKSFSNSIQYLPLKKQLPAIFEYAYNLADYSPTPTDRQQLRTVNNIIKTKKANCTGYSTIICSVLKNLKIPHNLKFTNYGKGFEHVYVECNNVALDCVNGQTETKKPLKGKFNSEIPYLSAKIFPMITQINGINNTGLRKSVSVNGFFDTVANLLGDECKRSCDLKHLSDATARQQCKDACVTNQTTGIQYDISGQCAQMYPNDLNAQQDCIRQAYGGRSRGIEQYLPYILGGVGLYLIMKK